VVSALTLGAPTPFNAAIPFSDLGTPFNGGTPVAITVQGHGATPPTFTVTGPFSDLTISHGGKAWSLAAPLAAGRTLVVVHRLGGTVQRGPRLTADNVTNWSLLTATSSMWLLNPGTSTIAVGGTGTGTISMSYEPRWWVP
jgi:hypothetical protein